MRQFPIASLLLLMLFAAISACGGGGSSDGVAGLELNGALSTDQGQPLVAVQVTATIVAGSGPIGLVDADATDANGKFDLTVSSLASAVDLDLRGVNVSFVYRIANIPAETARVAIDFRYSPATGRLVSQRIQYEDSQGRVIGVVPTPTPSASPTPSPSPGPTP